MTLQQLEYFLATLQHGSFGRAAAALGLAQPSVSEQVRRLEAELGVELVCRAGRGVAPTEAGMHFRGHAEHVVTAMRRATGAFVPGVDRLHSMTIAVTPATRWLLGSTAITRMREVHPKQHLRLVPVGVRAAVARVHDGDCDAALVALPIDDERLSIRPLAEDELVYVAAGRGRDGTFMRAAELNERPLVLADGCVTSAESPRSALLAFAQQDGVTLQPALELDGFDVAAELARASDVGAIVSSAWLRAEPARSAGLVARWLTPAVRVPLALVSATDVANAWLIDDLAAVLRAHAEVIRRSGVR